MLSTPRAIYLRVWALVASADPESGRLTPELSGSRDRGRMSDGFVVRDLFPTHSIHLIYGPARSGASTLHMQIMDEVAHSLQVFGHDSIPSRFCYMACNTPRAAIRAKMIEMGIDPSLTPHLSLVDIAEREDRTIEAVHRAASELVPGLRVIYLDSILGLCPGNINIYRESANFLAGVLKLCTVRDLTIIATAECTKSNDSPIQERIVGSVAWGSMCGTLIHIEATDLTNLRDIYRTVTIMPRRRMPVVASMALDEDTHRFIPQEMGNTQMDIWLTQMPLGAEFTAHDVQEAASGAHMSRATAFRWLCTQVEIGIVKQLRRGVYCKPAQTPPN
jgi:hypothetical protein